MPHEVRVTEPDTFEHDATAAWYHGPRAALARLDLAPGGARGIGIAGMVPSLTAVDARGRPVSPGLLYGDRRGQTGQGHLNPLDSGEGGAFLAWTAERWPEVHGYWPAQAVGGAAIGGAPVIDVSVAMSYYPIHDGTEWDASRLADIGVRPEQMPRVLADQSVPAARVGDTHSMSALREELHERVDRLSDEQVLDALGELRTRVDRTDDQQPPRPRLSFTAVMRSGEGDLAERVEDVLRERFNRST